MAKLTRILNKLFGSSAGTDQIAQFGSLLAGSPEFTTDPAVMQSLSNWLTGWLGAAIGGNSPAIEDMNAFCYVMSYQLSYLFQQGVPEWDTSTTYYIGSYVNSSGNLYISVADNNTGNPLSDTTKWIPFGTTAPNVQEFTASGTYTLPTGPTPLYILVEAWGAGGGGGGGNSGGTSGADGGDTTFGGTQIVAGGGKGAHAGGGAGFFIGALGGTGSVATSATVEGTSYQGNPGGAGNPAVTGVSFAGGFGGATSLGGAGTGGATTGGTAVANSGSGGGGGGTGASGISTGSGGGAGAYSYAYISGGSLASTSPVVIGVGGTHGSGGASASNGGDGANGRVRITAFF